MVVKIKLESCCIVDIEWEHNHSVQSLEASNFRDVSPDCVDRVYQLFESGHTPSLARHQYLQDIRGSCKEELDFHKKKADRSVVPRIRDLIIHKILQRDTGGKGGGGGVI